MSATSQDGQNGAGAAWAREGEGELRSVMVSASLSVRERDALERIAQVKVSLVSIIKQIQFV